MMRIIEKVFDDIAIIQYDCFNDVRGFFCETYRKDIFDSLGIVFPFVQDNHSGSNRHVLRGLHFQWEPAMGKLMRVTIGKAFLVAVDVRKKSKYFGKWYGKTLSSADNLLIWAPSGFARGFCVLSDYAEVQYKCTGIYNRQNEAGIRWNDPGINIEWPVADPVLSDKDANAPTLKEWSINPLSDLVS